MKNLLEVRNLSIEVPTRNGLIPAVDGISFSIASGRKLALVGESGSGKSLTALSLMRLIEKPVVVASGEIVLGDVEISALSDEDFRSIRGGEIAMIYQDPMSTLNPIMRIGKQIVETIRLHSDRSQKVAKLHAIELLRDVGLLEPEKSFDSYPFEMSGGMLQRVVIAMALSGTPKLLIADEATTALDVTTQARVLDLIDQLSADRDLSILLITHDLGVAAQFADEIMVMYAGKIVEKGHVGPTFSKPIHPYTRGLLESRCDYTIDFTKPIKSIVGQPPNLTWRLEGCAFQSRCNFSIDRCLRNSPVLEIYSSGEAACFRADEIAEMMAP